MVNESMSLKILIFPLSLVVAVAVAVFFIKPAYSEMMGVKNSLKEKNIRLDNLQKQNQKLQKVKSKWESLIDEKILVSAALPEEDNVDAYVSELTAKASRSGILLANIKLAQKSETTSVTEGQPAYVCQAGSLSESLTQTGAPPAQPPSTEVAPPAADAAGMDEIGAVGGLDGSAGAPKGCLKTVGISLSATGSWEQLLDFFKYLEDMNRISNVNAVSLSVANQSQDQAPSDLLTADISAIAFFKEKSKSGNALLADSLASQEDFNRKAVEKLKNAIYSPYDVPAVSPSGERNIFK